MIDKISQRVLVAGHQDKMFVINTELGEVAEEVSLVKIKEYWRS